VNKTATIHTPQTAAKVKRHARCEETRKWKGFTVTLCRWKLNAATAYADRPTDLVAIWKEHTY